MMRPIDELMAYYAFGQVKTRRIRRPRLSPEAQELANEVIIMLSNPVNSNNYKEEYVEN